MQNQVEGNGKKWKKEGSRKHSPAVGNVGLDLHLKWKQFFFFLQTFLCNKPTVRNELVELIKPLTYSTPQLLYVKIK